MGKMAMVGAIGGAAQGFQTALKMQMEEDRQARIAQLKAKESRETNRQNNDQRHQQRTAEQDQAHGQRMDQLGQSQEYSLESLAKQDEYARGQEDYKRKNRDQWEDVTGKDGTVIGKRNTATGEEKRFPASSTDRESINWKPITEQTTDEFGTTITTTQGYQGLGNRGSVGDYIPNKPPESGGENTEAQRGPGGRTFEEMFEALKKQNGDKFTDEQYREFIQKKYGIAPNG